MFPGVWVAGSSTRATRPPSWSMLIRDGTSAPVDVDTSWMPFDRPAACSGLSTLWVQAKYRTPPRWYFSMISRGVPRPNSATLAAS